MMTFYYREQTLRATQTALTGLLLFCAGCTGAPHASTDADPGPGTYGYLVIEDVGTDKTCKIDLNTPRKIIMKDQEHCAFGWVGKMWFEHAASAITISFVQNSAYRDDCKEDSISAYSKNFTIKTARSGLTSSDFTLNDIRALPADRDVIVPGVRVTHADFDGIDPAKDVACLFIAPSTLP